jgi:hypothetical protein
LLTTQGVAGINADVELRAGGTMKNVMLTTLIIGCFALIFSAFPAYSQPLEPFGKIELSGGVEKEAHTNPGGRFTFEGLGVLPFVGGFGGQAAMHVIGGLGARVGFNAAPVFAFPGGKVGFFVSYQHRGMRGTDFVHLIPSVAFYLPQFNINAWYSQPVSGAQREEDRVEYGINRLQASVSYFAGSDWWGPFLRRDNLELLLGIQVNTFAGAGHNKLGGGTGVGPVLGISMLYSPAVAVNVIRATFDDQGRYRVATGLEFFFDPKGSTTLKEMRRKYLEPNFDGPQSAGEVEHHKCHDCD